MVNQCCSCLNHLDKLKEHSPEKEDEAHDSKGVGKPLQNLRDESTQPREGETTQGLKQFKNEARRLSTRGDGSMLGAKWKPVTEMAESSSIVGKEIEVEACKELVAGGSAFNASKPAEQGHDGQVFTPGFMRSLSGSSPNLPGLNLEVALGQLCGLIEVHCGPTDQVNHPVEWAEADGPDFSLVRGSTALANKGLCKSINTRTKGKQKLSCKETRKFQPQKRGLFDLVSRYGHEGASTSKQASKHSVFRGSVAEASLSASIDSENAEGRRILSEAQATVQMGAVLGLQYHGKESESRVGNCSWDGFVVAVLVFFVSVMVWFYLLPLESAVDSAAGLETTVMVFGEQNFITKRNSSVLSFFIMEIKADGNDGSLILLKQGAEARVFESTFVEMRSIVKERFSKKYRHSSLDSKLILKCLNAEARCMTRGRPLGVCTPTPYAVDAALHTLTFEYVEGSSIGDAIGKLHNGGLIHGDLTTSNMLIQSNTNQLMDPILAAYRKSSKQWSSTLNKLAQVQQRGRKHTMIG
ncbi:EKC/KEOPS complex subunit TP53RK [Camellia lanceoleosa]|uniref:EKC/KEOPS complex subunit TP53RK n=1 Tax=Camellia lanceoleosa TaxID=1840588 RepID=A0ACC0FP71_9ERIC|nr:EKC/KEOPS complex subunit TP53RK [Camellia lanceoleosa]